MAWQPTVEGPLPATCSPPTESERLVLQLLALAADEMGLPELRTTAMDAVRAVVSGLTQEGWWRTAGGPQLVS